MKIKNIILTAILAVLLTACAVTPNPVCVKENRVYCNPSGNFTGRWYDYYERAMSCMEGECYDAALADLNETLKLRTEDQRMARTFGMHFSDYFPHREKGLIYFNKADYEAAEKELELSIKQYPSDKAYFYLDKVRVRLMEQKQSAVSVPRLFVNVGSEVRGQRSGVKYPEPRTPNPEPLWTKDDPVVISGTAEDEQYVSEILVKGKRVFLENSSQKIQFREQLNLGQGRHEVEIIARNLRNQEAAQKLFIHVDRVGPVISLTAFGPEQGIQGRLYDESGEIFLFADGKNIPIPKGETAEFSIPAESGREEMILIAKDRLGNETVAELRADMRAGFDLSGILLADRGSGYLLQASDTSYPAPRTPNPVPEIILETHTAEPGFGVPENVYIKGSVRSGNTVRKVSINDQPVVIQPGRVIFFSQFVRLEKGENTIRIEAEDESGNKGSKSLLIPVEIPEAFKLKYRYCLALHPFETLADPQDQAEQPVLFRHFFLKNIVDRGRFQVMVRDPEPLTPSPEPLTPDSVLIGSFYETRNGIEIAVRMADISSGEILAVKDVFSESKDRQAYQALSEKLSEKFHRAFPLMDAAVTGVDDKGLDFFPEKWNPEKGEIKLRWPLIVYHCVDKSGTEIIGKTRVAKIAQEVFRAEPVSGRKYEIRAGDRIISE